GAVRGRSDAEFCRPIPPQAELPLDGIGNPAAGMAVTVRIHRVGHGVVGALVPDQPLRHGDDVILYHAAELHGPGLYRLRPLRLPAHHQHRLAQGRGLLLETTGVCQHQIRPGHKVMHLVRRQRVDEMDPGRAPKIGVHCFPHHRAQVHRVHQLHVP
ncbi:HTH cro/C1-type domain-containing protein, partial [Dysosmobacter welbionis]